MSQRAKPHHLRLIDGSVGRGARGGRAAAQSSPDLDPADSAPAGQDLVAGAEALHDRAPVSGAHRPLLGLEDAALVRLALDGQSAAFEALYRKHVAFAMNLATRIEGSTRDVEDVVHDAFIKAMNRLGDLSDPAAFRSWLGSIVVYAVRSRLRRQRLMAVLGLSRGADPVELDNLTSPRDSPLVRANLAQVYALLRTHPVDERIAWTLRYVEGHELEVVARLSDCSLATIKRRIARAQQFLEEHFVSPEALTAEPPTPKPSAGSDAVLPPPKAPKVRSS